MEVKDIEPKVFLVAAQKLYKKEKGKPDYLLKVLLDSDTAMAYNDTSTLYQIIKQIIEV